MNCGHSGRVSAWIIEPDGTRRLVFRDKGNTAGANFVGYLTYWSSRSATSVPVAHVGYKYGTTEVYAATSNAAGSTYSTTGHQFVATASWTNNTGAERTITALRSLSAADANALEFAKLGSQSIVVAIGATLEVQWTMILRQNSSGGTGMPQEFFGRMIQYLRAATTTYPISHLVFTDNHSTNTTVALGSPTSGGSTSSSNVVWQVSATGASGSDTLAQLQPYQDINGAVALVDNNSGRSDTWLENTSITVTMTLTWVTV